MIVVMKDGVIQQIGKPQEVYDHPINLFVAKFLGTPPINVFRAEIRAGMLMIGGEALMDIPGMKDQKVFAAIRPEGFIPDENGPLSLNLSGVEVMGRDVSVVATHADCENEKIRAIIDADNCINVASKLVKFAVKREKVHLFDAETQMHIPVKAQ